jgi:hypothetical protein
MRLPVLLGQPVQKLGDLIAEVLDDLLHGDGRVLDGVVQGGSGQTVSSSLPCSFDSRRQGLDGRFSFGR